MALNWPLWVESRAIQNRAIRIVRLQGRGESSFELNRLRFRLAIRHRFSRFYFAAIRPTYVGIIERGGTASLRSRTCVKRNVVYGARFKGLSLYFLYQKENLIRIKMGLDTYPIRIQTRTPL